MKLKGTYLDCFHLLDGEVQNHRFFDPIIDDPFPAFGRACYAQFSCIQIGNNASNGGLGSRFL